MKKTRRFTATIASILAFTAILATPMTSYAAWEQTSQGWRYTSENGYAAGTFIQDNGKTYYMKPSGIMAQNEWINLGDDTGPKWYYAGFDGAIYVGEQVVGSEAYTFDSNGLMVLDGVHRDGLEDELLEQAFVWTAGHMAEDQYGVDLINQIRAEVNLPPVQLDQTLCLANAYKCFHQVKYDYIGHYYNGVETAFESLSGMLRVSSLSHRTYDNAAFRGGTNFKYKDLFEYLDEATAGLKASPSHYAAMIAPNAKTVGLSIAYTRRANGEYNFYYSALLQE